MISHAWLKFGLAFLQMELAHAVEQLEAYPPQGAQEGRGNEELQHEIERLKEEVLQASQRETEASTMRRKEERDMMNKV